MRALVVATDDWWKSLTKEQQKQYLEEHPNSKYAKKSTSTSPKWTVQNNKPKFNDKTKVYPKAKIEGLEHMAFGLHTDVGIGWIESVSIDPKVRGKGVGKKAVQYIEDTLKKDGAKEIRGEALESSLPFWRAMGYTVANKPTPKNRWPIRKVLGESDVLKPVAVDKSPQPKIVWKPKLKKGSKVLEVDIPSGNTKGFFDTYSKATEEDSRYKGQQGAMRIWRDPESEGHIFIDLEEKKMSKDLKVAYLHAIQVPQESAGKGLASKALQWAIETADREGVSLMLKPKAFGSKGLSTQKLKAWYARHGFLQQELGDYMIRPPKGSASRETTPTQLDE